MTNIEIKKANLIKMGFQCNKCSLIYEIDHPVTDWYGVDENDVPYPRTDLCAPVNDSDCYTYERIRTSRNYTYYRARNQWYYVKPPLTDMFLGWIEIEEAIIGRVEYPKPISIMRQVDIYTAAEKLGMSSPLNDYQKKRAKVKSFIERIKG